MKNEIKDSNLSNIKFLIQYAWKHDKTVFFQFIVYTLMAPALPFIGLLVTKFVLDGLTTNLQWGYLVEIIIVSFVLSSIIYFIVNYIREIYFPRMVRLRFQLFEEIQRNCLEIDYNHLEDPEMLDKIQLSFQAVDNCFVGIEGTLHKLFQTPAKFVILIFNSIFIFNLNPIVFVVLCTSVLVSHILYRKISKYSFSKAKELSRLERKTNYYYNTTSDFSFGKDIRIFQIQDLLRRKFKHSIEEKVAVHRKIQNYTLLIKTFCNIASVLGEGVAYIYLVFSYLNGSMSVGDFFFYFGLITIFSSNLVEIVTDIAFVDSESLKIRYFRDFLSFEDDADKNKLKSIKKATEYSIEFRNVSFKYPKSDNWVCRNLSFTIESGQSIAMVGYNGAGKSTITKLLMRLYDPIEGAIFINGINIKEFDRKEYYKLFSVIFQDIKIFAASVEQNIAMSSEGNICKEKVGESAKIANIDQKIESLQNGYNTNLLKVIDEDGTELSGGQNQRIALARAIYKDGPFFILDEPTSALDPLAEYQFYMNFRNIVRGKTAIYISHRLASTKFCDKIFCFEKERLIEEGTHEELLRLNGTYAKLYRIQSEKFQTV